MGPTCSDRRAGAGAGRCARPPPLAQGLALGRLAQRQRRERDAIDALKSPALSQADPSRLDVELVITRGAIQAQAGDLRGVVDDLTAVIGWSRQAPPHAGCPTRTRRWWNAEYRLELLAARHGPRRAGGSLARDSDQVWELPFAHATASLFDVGRGGGRRPNSTSRTQPRPHGSRRCHWRSSMRGSPRRTWCAPAGRRDARSSCSRRCGTSCRRPIVPALRRSTSELEAEALLRRGSSRRRPSCWIGPRRSRRGGGG